MATEFVHALRTEELELAVPYLPSGGRVLELGAGDGWQAAELARRGFAMTAVDVPPARPPEKQFFPVAHYDGRTLPFADGAFDAVYSSNVMEHVVDFDYLQRELARVLRPGGVAVHCVPTGVWRIWTSVGHPLYAARWALRLGRGTPQAAGNTGPATSIGFGKLMRGILPPRHGEHGSLLAEHWLFTRRGWNGRFRDTRWEVSAVHSTHLFYTGNELFGLRLGNSIRRRFAAMLGSSTLIYVLRPSGTGSAPPPAAARP